MEKLKIIKLSDAKIEKDSLVTIKIKESNMLNINNLSALELSDLQQQIEERLSNAVFPYDYADIINETLSNDELNDDGELTDEMIIIDLKSLYAKGYITYPLTENSSLPLSDYDSSFKVILGVIQNKLERHPLQKINDLDLSAIPLAFTDKDMDHHGIIPTGKIIEETLTDMEFYLLKRISKRYIKVFI